MCYTFMMQIRWKFALLNSMFSNKILAFSFKKFLTTKNFNVISQLFYADPFNSVPNNVKFKKIMQIRSNIKKAMIYKQAKSSHFVGKEVFYYIFVTKNHFIIKLIKFPCNINCSMFPCNIDECLQLFSYKLFFRNAPHYGIMAPSLQWIYYRFRFVRHRYGGHFGLSLSFS